VPLALDVVLLVDGPLERGAVVRVPHHEDLGQVAVAVEDVLAWVFADVDQPFEALEGDVGSVHVDTSVFGQEGEAVEVTL
jgi:hypothetical protein